MGSSRLATGQMVTAAPTSAGRGHRAGPPTPLELTRPVPNETQKLCGRSPYSYIRSFILQTCSVWSRQGAAPQDKGKMLVPCRTGWHSNAARGKPGAHCAAPRGTQLGIQWAGRGGGHSAPSRPNPQGRGQQSRQILGSSSDLFSSYPAHTSSEKQVLPPPSLLGG